MAVRTGYTKAELAALAERVSEGAEGLVRSLPEEPLWTIHLACCCDRCIDPDAHPKLCRTPPPQLTEVLITQYFGGVSAVETIQTDEARYEARVILTHVLALLGQMSVLPEEEAHDMRRRLSYLDADYLIPYLLDTGALRMFPDQVTADIRAYLVDLVAYNIARNSVSLDVALTYLTLFTDALPDVIDAHINGPPRRHLQLWTAIALRFVSNGDDSGSRGKDFHLFYSGMPLADRECLLAALDAPEVERLIERYAFQARDPKWLRYLSNLLDWREKTILATRFSEYKDGRF
jgi:hypothetical protein